MTHTLSIDNVGGTPVDVSIANFAKTSLELVNTTVAQAGRQVISTYVLTTSDVANPTSVVVQSTAGTDGIRRSSITLKTVARDVDADGTEVATKPISVVVAINVPTMSIEARDVMDLVLAGVNLMYPSLTSKVPDLGTVSALLFGITGLYS